MVPDGWTFRAPWRDWKKTDTHPGRVFVFTLLPTIRIYVGHGLLSVALQWLFFDAQYFKHYGDEEEV